MITVVGLGPGDPGALTRAAESALRSGATLHLRTRVHPTVRALEDWGLVFTSHDDRYRTAEDFDGVYAGIVADLLELGGKQDVVYAVPGHPLVGERTVRMLLAQEAVPVRIVAGLSGLEAVYAALGVDPGDGVTIVDAMDLDPVELQPSRAILALQVWSGRVASDLKLTLMDVFDDAHEVIVIRGAGIPGEERTARIPLHELDRLPWLDHLTSVWVPAGPIRGVPRARALMARLRAEDGCPWDREQTHASLRRYCLEEAYEVVDAIDREDDEDLEEELGDLLLQVLFHARIAEEEGRFDLGSIADRLCDKLEERHPHIFGSVQAETADQVLANWEDLKASQRPETAGTLDGVAEALPALTRSEKLQQKAARAGFGWPERSGARAKLAEELHELDQALAGDGDIGHELGDVLMAVTNLARMVGVDPEMALRSANARFTRRFAATEEALGGSLVGKSLEQMLETWNRVKAAADRDEDSRS